MCKRPAHLLRIWCLVGTVHWLTLLKLQGKENLLMAAMLLFPILQKVYFLGAYQTCITIQGQSDHIHILSGTVTLPQHFASPLCCNYKYRVLGDLQWHDADTKFCQNSFTGSKVVSHTHTHTHTQCYIYRWLLPWNPCNSASKPSVQVSPNACTSTVTVGVGSTLLT